MTEIAEVNTTSPDESAGGRRRKGSGLDSMVLPELKQLASSLGLRGTGAMRKGQLIDAIRSAQNGSGGGSSNGNNASAERSGSGGQSVLVEERPQDAPQRTAPAVEASTSNESRDTGGNASALQRPRHRHAGQRPADGERRSGGRQR